METLEVKNLFGGEYKDKKVLITGHTGFKGSWLAYWLQLMGADVHGYSLPPDTEPSHFLLINSKITTTISDILDFRLLENCFQSVQPDIVFHLAAQSLVRRSYREPLNTFATNVMGTANVLEACRTSNSVRVVVIVTSDKCYQNKEWEWGYRENDPLGGYDPYSASKGCAELVTSAFRKSFSARNAEASNQQLIATVRAGNVIGGGDWAEDRLIPDVIRAASLGKKVKIRNPHTIRPWQHVLEPLSGYLLLGQLLLEGNSAFADAWNFGPSDEDAFTVSEMLERVKTQWTGFEYIVEIEKNRPHEAGMLKLDSSMARQRLGWRPVWDCAEALEQTIRWYRAFYEQGIVSTRSDLEDYLSFAHSKGVAWVT